MSEIVFEHRLGHSLCLRVVKGDLTAENVDAIVNAANSHLAHGGGVAGAIVRKGGAVIQQESDAVVDRAGRVPVGSAVVTSAGSLPARYVIQTVGPQWGEGDEDSKLANCIISTLDLAEENGCESISFPAVSSGIFGFPKPRCAKVILDAVDRYVKENPHLVLQEIRMCNIDEETAGIFEKEARARYGQ